MDEILARVELQPKIHKVCGLEKSFLASHNLFLLVRGRLSERPHRHDCVIGLENIRELR